MKADYKTEWRIPFPDAPLHTSSVDPSNDEDRYTGQITFSLLENTTLLLSAHINIRGDLGSDEDTTEETL